MNFQVGDKVVDVQDMSLWDNIYHFQKNLNRLKPKTVVAANEKFFTCTPGVDVDSFSGLSDYRLHSLVFLQKTGRPWDGTAALGNITRNWDGVTSYMNKHFDERLTRCDAEDVAAIKRLEAEIEAKQKTIEAIKAGKRTISHAPDIVDRDFVLARKKEILAIINQK